MSMMRDEDGNGEHGIHGEPAGTRGFEVSGRKGGKEKLQGQWAEFAQMGLPVGEEDDAVTLEIEREKDIRDLEPYSIHESTLQEDDAKTKGYMELWSHYECAYNALAHRRMADETQELIDRLITAVLGEKVAWDGPDDPPFHAVIWRVGQERARLLETARTAEHDAASMRAELEIGYKYHMVMEELMQWLEIAVEATATPAEVFASIRTAIVKLGNAR